MFWLTIVKDRFSQILLQMLKARWRWSFGSSYQWICRLTSFSILWFHRLPFQFIVNWFVVWPLQLIDFEEDICASKQKFPLLNSSQQLRLNGSTLWSPKQCKFDQMWKALQLISSLGVFTGWSFDQQGLPSRSFANFVRTIKSNGSNYGEVL